MRDARIKLNIINFIAFSLTVIIIFSGSRAVSRLETNVNGLNDYVESQWRERARTHIEYTIHKFNRDIDKGYVDVYDDDSVAEWVKENYTTIRTDNIGSSGWVAELGSELVIDDQSTTRMVIRNNSNTGEKLLMDDIICDGGKSDKQIEKILNQMKEGKPTKSNDRIWYNIDDSTQWVEFNYYPLTGGLDNEHKTIYGESNAKYKRYIFVLGINSEDVHGRYARLIGEQQNIIGLVYITMIASCLFSIILMSVLLYRHTPNK